MNSAEQNANILAGTRQGKAQLRNLRIGSNKVLKSILREEVVEKLTRMYCRRPCISRFRKGEQLDLLRDSLSLKDFAS